MSLKPGYPEALGALALYAMNRESGHQTADRAKVLARLGNDLVFGRWAKKQEDVLAKCISAGLIAERNGGYSVRHESEAFAACLDYLDTAVFVLHRAGARLPWLAATDLRRALLEELPEDIPDAKALVQGLIEFMVNNSLALGQRTWDPRRPRSTTKVVALDKSSRLVQEARTRFPRRMERVEAARRHISDVRSAAWRPVARLVDHLRREDYHGSHLQTFVERDWLAQLDNRLHQFLVGRRGAGKTHLLLCFNELLESQFSTRRALSIYVDMRSIGGIAAVEGEPMLARTSRHFRSFLVVFADAFADQLNKMFKEAPFRSILDRIGKGRQSRAKYLLKQLKLVARIGHTLRDFGPVRLEDDVADQISAELGVRTSGPQAAIGATHHEAQKQTGTGVTTLEYTDIGRIIAEVVKLLDLKYVCLLIDEWSQVPTEEQPFLAEFIERALILRPSKVVLKIAVVLFQNNLSRIEPRGEMGLQPGVTIFGIDLDNTPIPEMQPREARVFYRRLLHRHLIPYIPEVSVLTARHLEEAIFEGPAMMELIRASGGIPRDFLNLFTKALKEQRKGKISPLSVRLAANEWFKLDKETAVSENRLASALFEEIVGEMLGRRKSTFFLIDKGRETDPYFQQLVILRVLHKRLSRIEVAGYRGKQFELYAIDYGRYADRLLLGGERRGIAVLNRATIKQTDLRRAPAIWVLGERVFTDHERRAGLTQRCSECDRFFETDHPVYLKFSVCPNCGQIPFS